MVRDAIKPDDYTRECDKLLRAINQLMETKKWGDAELKAFSEQYRLTDCNMAFQRIKKKVNHIIEKGSSAVGARLHGPGPGACLGLVP